MIVTSSHRPTDGRDLGTKYMSVYAGKMSYTPGLYQAISFYIIFSGLCFQIQTCTSVIEIVP